MENTVKELTEQQKKALVPLMGKATITDREAQQIYDIVFKNQTWSTGQHLCRPCVIKGRYYFNTYKL